MKNTHRPSPYRKYGLPYIDTADLGYGEFGLIILSFIKINIKAKEKKFMVTNRFGNRVPFDYDISIFPRPTADVEEFYEMFP